MRSMCLHLATLFLVSAAGHGQPPSADAVSPDPVSPDAVAPGPVAPVARFEERTSVDWVLVPVTVKNERGGFVTGLERHNFRLIVDGRYQAFESFDAEAAAPISMIHLQDLSGSMAVGGTLEASRAALDCFTRALRPADELAVASFGSGRLSVDVPFTGDVEAAREAASTWQGYGSTALHDAVGWLPEIGLDGRHPRRAAVLLTDGADNASSLSAAGSRALVRRARLPVYVMALGSSSRPRRTAAVDETSNRALLEALARESGGRFFATGATVEAARDACRTIGEEIRHQYVLGFQVTDEGDATDHRLGVEVTHPHRTPLVVTHRAAYRGGTTPSHRRAG